ncbi:eukaryotic translation initiation factor 4B3-like [Tasmannia lanceolata]|uniref:eukaryotic translation initiation factor 4B3-like n=1 Tax=Tasmannia lanceolata TaxID=3420 RepID=UPI004064A5E1
MATEVSAWAKPGSWALDSEQQEPLEILQKDNERFDSDLTQQKPLSDFPSLSAATIKPTKKKKSQPVSLAEFTTGKIVTHGGSKAQAQTRPVGLTQEELTFLPTGPRERSAEELERSSSRLGGGFRNYGSGEEANSARWGSSRVSDEPRRNGGLGFNRESAPSRADEIDDWGAGKKSAPPAFERRDRGERGGFFDSQSRADESESWVSNKSFVTSETRRGGLGFDGYKEKRGGGFEMFQKEGLNGGDSDSWGRKKEEGSGRPRIVLQPRTVPVSNGEGLARAKGSNPFGEARPREEVLAEKGQDWKMIDEKIESMKIKELGSGGLDGPSFGKKSFGSGNGRGGLSEDRTEMNWRKTDSADVSPRVEKVDDGVADN